MSKACSSCHKVKPLREFYVRTASADGHKGICKSCERAFRCVEKRVLATGIRLRREAQA